MTTEHNQHCDDNGWDHPGPCIIETERTPETVAALAELEQQLAELADSDELAADTPTRDILTALLAGRTFSLPRGVTLTTRDDRGVIYLETKTRRDWETRTDVRDRLDLTVYGTVTRAGRESSGSVQIQYYYRDPADADADAGARTHCYWSTMTGSSVPDGARVAVAGAVLATVAAVTTPEQWHELADENDHARRLADVRAELGTATRAVADARAKLARIAR